MLPTLARHVGIAQLQARSVVTYRANYLVGLVVLLLQLFLLKVVWTALYAGRPSVGDTTLSLTVAYVTLATLQNWLFNPWIFSLIPERVRDGRVGTDLARPASFLGQIVSAQLGRTAATVPFLLIALPFAVLIAGAQPPASPWALLLYGVSLALGYAVTTALSVLLGLVAFWTMEVHGLFIIYRISAQFFSGALVPVWFLPGALRTLADFLPFQAVIYLPTTIYLGGVPGPGILKVMALQLGWLVGLSLLARVMWLRAVRRVVVQGG